MIIGEKGEEGLGQQQLDRDETSRSVSLMALPSDPIFTISLERDKPACTALTAHTPKSRGRNAKTMRTDRRPSLII